MKKLLLLGFAILSLSNFETFAQLNFKNYSSQNEITDIVEDGNFIWISTTGGVFKRNKSTGSLVASYNMENGLGSNNVKSMLIDGQGNKWFATFGRGITKYDSEADLWTIYDQNNGFPELLVYSLAIDLENNIWASVGDGAYKFDGTGWIHYGSSDGLIYGGINTIEVDDFGNVCT